MNRRQRKKAVAKGRAEVKWVMRCLGDAALIRGKKRPPHLTQRERRLLETTGCTCTGCDRCAPKRGQCWRPRGDYADHQCPECHKRSGDLATDIHLHGPLPGLRGF